MNTNLKPTQELALIAMFTAIVYVLRITIEIPFPLASYLKLEIWEIPIYIALISFRFRTSLSVAALTFLLVQVFSTGLPPGPAYNLIAILSVMLGILIIKRISNNRIDSIKTIILTIFTATILRIVIMTIVNATVLPMDAPFGYNIPPEVLPSMLIITGIFNALITVYSVFLAAIISIKINNKNKAV